MIRTEFKDTKVDLDEIETINYKDTKFLSNFISDQGKILPRRVTGLSAKQQKKITKLIKWYLHKCIYPIFNFIIFTFTWCHIF